MALARLQVRNSGTLSESLNIGANYIINERISGMCLGYLLISFLFLLLILSSTSTFSNYRNRQGHVCGHCAFSPGRKKIP